MNDSGDLRRIDWRTTFPFLRIFSAVPRALAIPPLVLGFAFILTCYLGGRTLDFIWTTAGQGALAPRDRNDLAAGTEIELFSTFASNFENWQSNALKQTTDSPPKFLRRGPFDLLLKFELGCFGEAARGFATGQITSGLDQIRVGLQGLIWLVRMHFVYALLFLTLVVLANALFGGAICRIAAIHAARRRWIGPLEAVREFSLPRLFDLAAVPGFFIGFGLALGLGLFVVGLIGAIPGIGPIFVGLSFLISLLLGIGLAFAVLGLLFATHLGPAALAAERADAFESVNRSCNYLLTRPLSYLFYGVVALFAGGLAYAAVRLVASLALQMTHGFLGAGMSWFGSWKGGEAGSLPKLDALWSLPVFSTLPGSGARPWWGDFEPVSLHRYESIGMFLMALAVYTLVGLVAGYVVSFYHCAATEIYLLLRREIDGTEFDEVAYTDPDEIGLSSVVETAQASTALPVLGQK